MNIGDLRQEKIAILGLSKEGISSAEFLFRNQIPFTVLEKKNKKELGDKFSGLKKWSCEYRLDEDHLKNLEDFTLILRSPGVPLFLQEIKKLRKQKIKISSHTKLFMELCPTKNIIGVTGTKGKGTTCKLIESILKADKKDVYVGGNIGEPPFDFFDKLTKASYVVLELSSFQTEDFEKSPHITVVLGIALDHLAPESPESPNYHSSFEDYINAKKQLVRFQKESDYIIVKNEDKNSKSFIKETKAKPYCYSVIGEVDRGGFIQDQKLKFRNQNEIQIGKVEDIKLKGRHHLENICAALTVGSLIDCATLSIQKGLFEFQGYEHRLEFIDIIDGVSYYDDSAATNPEPAIAAIDAFPEPMIIILGGSEKGQDYTELGGKIINSNVKVVYLIGDMARKIEEAIWRNQKLLRFHSGQAVKSPKLKIIKAGYPKMEKIVKDCVSLANEGDIVLLSPACASFDMFKNYRDRGDQFKEEIKKLKVEN